MVVVAAVPELAILEPLPAVVLVKKRQQAVLLPESQKRSILAILAAAVEGLAPPESKGNRNNPLFCNVSGWMNSEKASRVSNTHGGVALH